MMSGSSWCLITSAPVGELIVRCYCQRVAWRQYEKLCYHVSLMDSLACATFDWESDHNFGIPRALPAAM